MYRTKKIMTIVTTSLLLAGSSTLRPSLSTAFGQTTTQPEKALKTDPAVNKAADQIYAEFLEGTTRSDAKTRDEIAKHFPALSLDTIDVALEHLQNSSKAIVRLGDGARAPYRYYDSEQNG